MSIHCAWDVVADFEADENPFPAIVKQPSRLFDFLLTAFTALNSLEGCSTVVKLTNSSFNALFQRKRKGAMLPENARRLKMKYRHSHLTHYPRRLKRKDRP